MIIWVRVSLAPCAGTVCLLFVFANDLMTIVECVMENKAVESCLVFQGPSGLATAKKLLEGSVYIPTCTAIKQ